MEAHVRPARASDKAPLMNFIKDVWGGHDYIPRVWDHWLRDKSGGMFVVEVDGKPVGMNRLRFLEDGSAWLEGARVHPSYRGRGLASMLGKNSMKVAMERGVRTFRLTSGSTNWQAHRQIARIRFGEISRFSVYDPPGHAAPKDVAGVFKVRESEMLEAVKTIEGSKEYRLGSGVFWHDFTAASLTPEVLGRLVAKGSVWMTGEAAAVARRGAEGSWEEICFIGGPPRDAMRLVAALVGRAKKASERWVFVPKGSPIIHALREEGFRRSFAMILFERRAAKG